MFDPWRVLEIPITPDRYANLFEGLDAWLKWELISEFDLHLCVPPRSGSRIILKVNTDHTNLLNGLELWYLKELLDDQTIRQWVESNLISNLPIGNTMQVPVTKVVTVKRSNNFAPDPNLLSPQEFFTQSPKLVNQTPKIAQSPNFWQSLVTEFSLTWLLSLGVFLIVMSSAILAASRWRNFSVIGQYLILLAYTLAFGLAGVWAVKQERLRLTSNALSIISLMVIPVNFWAMSGLALGRSGGGIVVAILASLLLSGVGISLLKNMNAARYQWIALGLCWLHLGWRSFDILPLPILTTYGGLIATVITLLVAQRQEPILSRSALAIGYGALLLLVRASFFPGVSLQQLSLAFGLCGFICYRWRPDRQLNLDHPDRQFNLEGIGISLLIVGWSLSVQINPPIQAFIISILGLWLLIEETWQTSSRPYLTISLSLGCQTVWLAWRLIPETLRLQWINWGMSWTNSDSSIPIVGILLFPYALLIVLVGYVFHRLEKPLLAQHCDQLALGFTVFLNCLTFVNPITRAWSLTITASALILIPLRYAQIDPAVIYFSHFLVIASIFSHFFIHFFGSTLEQWSVLLLIVSLIEWFICLVIGTRNLSLRWQAWRDSAAVSGVLLAIITTVFVFGNVLYSTQSTLLWSGAWLLLPTMLMMLGWRSVNPLQKNATTMAIFALFLTFFFPDPATRTLGLGVATALITIPVVHQKSSLLSGLQLLFGFGAIINLFWQQEATFFFNLLSGIALGMIVINSFLPRQFLTIYRRSLAVWAMVISLTLFAGFTIVVTESFAFITVNSNDFFYDISYNFFLKSLPGLGMTTLAMAILTWREFQTWAWLPLNWGIALIIASGVVLREGTIEWLVIIYLSIGLLLQILRGWLEKLPIGGNTAFLGLTPILYGILGTLLRIDIPSIYSLGVPINYTYGLYTFAAAITLIAVKRQQGYTLPLVYLGLFGITYGASEMAISFSQRLTVGEVDYLSVIVLVIAIISYLYALLRRPINHYLQIDGTTIGYAHWGTSMAMMLLITFGTSPSVFAGKVGSVTLVLLSGYAFALGKFHEDWVYSGLATIIAAFYYIIYFAFPATRFILEVLEPYGVTIACFLSILIFLCPWQSWGWSARPWQRSAGLLPGIIIFLTWNQVAPGSLLIASAFYGLISHRLQNAKLMYLSLFLTNWSLWQILHQQQLTNPIWYATTIGLSTLVSIQFNPSLVGPEKRLTRHLFRLLATGLICFTSLWESIDSGLIAIWSIGLSFAFILAGLASKTRAYLLIGTATFIATITIQMTQWIGKNSLGVWGIGIFAGMVIILIVAGFESRREQITTIWQQWTEELSLWE